MEKISSREIHHSQDFAEVVLDLTGSAEWKGQGDESEHKSLYGSQEPAQRCQEETHTVVHEERVMEWIADGYIAVIGHGHQKDTF